MSQFNEDTIEDRDASPYRPRRRDFLARDAATKSGTKDVGEVRRQIDYQQEAIAELDKAISRLVNDLNPIMNNNPDLDLSTPERLAETVNTEVGAGIQSNTNRIHSLTELIYNVSGRLQI